MSAIPDEWGEPDSRPGFLYDVFWAALAVVVFGALAYAEPFSITVVATPLRLVGSAALGVSLGVVVTYLSFASESSREFWSDPRRRFLGIFLVAVGGQAGIMFAPTWTILTLLATFLTVIPVRLYVYRRTW